MRGRPIVILLTICALGFLGGLIARSSGGKGAATGKDRADRIENRDRGELASSTSRSGQGRKITIPTARSTDSMADLLALPENVLFSRLALWLIDAEEEEIASLWKELVKRGGIDFPINQLVFVVWTKLNPTAAIQAVAGTNHAEAAWWGWASHSPEAALAAALEDDDSSNIMTVMEALGECHPAFVLANFDQWTGLDREYALWGLEALGEGGDPREILDFLLERGSEGSEAMLRRLVRDDPREALHWAREADDRISPGPFGGEGNNQVLAVAEHLERLHPELLREMRDAQPEGVVRRAMDRFLFERLAREDIDSAIEMARKTKGPRIAIERWGKIGLALVDSEPQRAMEVWEEMMKDAPHVFTYGNEVHYPGGSSGRGYSSEDIPKLAERLLQVDPARLLATRPEGKSQWGDDWSELASAWAWTDVDGFKEYVTTNREDGRRSEYERILLGQLTGRGRMNEALEYAQGMEDRGVSALPGVIEQWKQFAWEDAKSWVEEAELTPEQRERLLPIVDPES